MILPGEPVPSFHARGATNPRYAFDSVAGRYVVLTFIGSTRLPGVQDYLRQLYASEAPFDDRFASAYLVSSDPQDEAGQWLKERYPGIRVFWDDDHRIAGLFGCLGPAGTEQISLKSWILDPALRVMAIIPVTDFRTHHERICDYLAGLPAPQEDVTTLAPVLMVPGLIEPELCRAYIAHIQAKGAQDSGYMQTDAATGQTVMVVDHGHKKRQDCIIEDQQLCDALRQRVMRRLVPQIARAFQFQVTRMERYLIACYDAQSGGHFRPHKDNTTLGTAHRRFAVSVNLNAEDYEGGDLRFPEFGMRTYRPPTGGAVVFSCSLLHEATPVTRGTRYCILPFLYDEAAAAIRLENAQHLQDPELRENVIASVLAKA